MTLLAVALVVWALLSLPAAVLMGKCIAHGLAPAADDTPVQLPAQRTAVEDVPAQQAPSRL